ncbi:MAG: diacylglycerol kinase [Bacillota bacterium]|nr:diacylglycerol kinase [Bacillota bacterium]
MKNKSLFGSFNNAINGVIYAIKRERNMKLHIAAAVIILVLSLFFRLSKLEYLFVFLAIAAVIICELFNTAIEVLVDIVVDVYHPKAKIIKDVAAGATLVAAFFSLVVAYFVFFNRVSKAVSTGITIIKNDPVHIAVIALIITVILVLTGKAFLEKGTPLRGGMPSGHTAIAFSITAAIMMWTNNADITILSTVVSLLVAQSRLENKTHNLIEVLGGASLGFSVTLILFEIFY